MDLPVPDRLVLSIVVFACYLAGALWLISSLHRSEDHSSRGRWLAGLALGLFGAAMHALHLWTTLVDKATFSLTISEAASLTAWSIAVLALALSWWRPRFAMIAAVLVISAAMVVIATIRGASGYPLEQHDWKIAAHIVLSIVAYALLTIAVSLAVALALLDRRLRTRKPLGWMKALPSMEALEAGTFQALVAGFSILTLALFSGFIFVEDLFAQHLIHKTVLSCLAWVVFAVLLFGRWRFGWRGRTAASWTLSGFALLALAYFGSKIVLEGILGRHWY